MTKECIFRASGGTRFKGEGGTPRCNRSAQKNSGYVTGYTFKILQQMLQDFQSVSDHFGTLCTKGLTLSNSCHSKISAIHDTRWDNYFHITIIWSNNIAHNRSSHQRGSINKGILKNLTKFTGKHLCRRL